MDIKEIVELMRELRRSGLRSLDYTRDGERLRLDNDLSTGPRGGVAEHDTSAGTDGGGPPGLEGNGLADRGAAAPPTFGDSREAPVECAADSCLVRSPVVGIFFAAPTPDSPPYVSVGSVVAAGQTVCIIEAMKLMNEVTCPADGQVLDIYVENNQRVEYGQPLMRIGPSAEDDLPVSTGADEETGDA